LRQYESCTSGITSKKSKELYTVVWRMRSHRDGRSRMNRKGKSNFLRTSSVVLSKWHWWWVMMKEKKQTSSNMKSRKRIIRTKKKMIFWLLLIISATLGKTCNIPQSGIYLPFNIQHLIRHISTKSYYQYKMHFKFKPYFSENYWNKIGIQSRYKILQ